MKNMTKQALGLLVFVVSPAAFWGFLTALIVNARLGAIVALVFVCIGLDICLRSSEAKHEKKVWDAIEERSSN